MTVEYYDRDGQPLSLWGWAALLGDEEYKRVAQDTVGDVWVSTVWLGLDHAMLRLSQPGTKLIFETMVFDVATGAVIEGPIRYATEAAAAEGHKYVVRRIERRNELYGGPLT